MSLGTSSGNKDPVSYVLIVECGKPQVLKIKSLNNPRLGGAVYIYIGSANLRNPMKRVLRHFKKVKRLRWHVDYLTSSCTPLASLIMRGLTEADLYNLFLNLSLRGRSDVDILVEPSIEGFGASDRAGHRTHLFMVRGVRDFNVIVSKLMELFAGIDAVSEINVVFNT